jgi:ABC-type uncharacterized transport system ATPase component
MKPDITTVRIEKRQNRAQILAFAFQESLEEGLFCRSPVVNEVVLEEARGLSRTLAYHRRAQLEAKLGDALDEVDQQIEELRRTRG